ncbi:hypothetical protein MVEN_00346500 [Mycena venus]|uniref:Uncharacterized protein n=1 Tax=Mycena venus TaxID=2733690 RepID=A0A8H7DAM5_9AGAR|nr:hypothetical protein MVEN_00346500 [Mycena venus]
MLIHAPGTRQRGPRWLSHFLGVEFVNECLEQDEGASQRADLGDGNGYPSCDGTTPTPRRNGKSASSGAYFLATLYEMPIAQGHNIVVNGYNLGRDWLIGNITKSPIDTASLMNTSMFTGTTSYGGYTYSSAISYVSGLLANSSDGVNHADTVGVNGRMRRSLALRPMSSLHVSPALLIPIPTLLLLLLGALCLQDGLRAGTDPTTHTHARYEDEGSQPLFFLLHALPITIHTMIPIPEGIDRAAERGEDWDVVLHFCLTYSYS